MFRSSSTTLFLGMTLALLPAIALSSDGLAELDRQAAAIQSNPEDYVSLEGIPLAASDEVVEMARGILNQAPETIASQRDDIHDFIGITEEDLPAKPVMEHDEWIDILVSRSMGEAEIRSLFQALDESVIPVRLVFIGIADGQKLNDGFMDFARWSKDLVKPPEGMIDPEVFSDRNIQNVPRMVFMRKGESVAEVDGLTNPEWLVRQVDQGRTGYLGNQGPVVAISERNLIEVMKERLEKIDLNERKQETVDTYWNRADFYSVPPAKEERSRKIDPSVIVNTDIVDGKGGVIMPAGTIVNPLHMRPFSMRLVIFNPNIEDEVGWASTLPAEQGIRDIFIITEVNRDGGWDHFTSIEDALDRPAYLMTQDVHERYDIRFTPSTVTADSDHFIVHEFALSQQKEP